MKNVPLTLSIALAFVLWTLMFSPWTSSFIPFWPTMCVSALILSTLAFLFTERTPREPKPDKRVPILRLWMENLLIGIAIAAVL